MSRTASAFATALLVTFSSFAAIPVRWTTDTFKVKPLSYECYHGETLDLAASLTAYGEPLALGGKAARMWWQTPDMGDEWYETNAVVRVDADTGATNVLAAVFSGAYDTGKERVTGFVGVVGENYRAAFELRFRASPGFEPSALPLPAKTIDCAKVTFLNPTNAPWATGGGGECMVTDVQTNGVSAVVGKVARIVIPAPVSTNGLASVGYVDDATNATLAAAKADAAGKYQPKGNYVNTGSNTGLTVELGTEERATRLSVYGSMQIKNVVTGGGSLSLDGDLKLSSAYGSNKLTFEETDVVKSWFLDQYGFAISSPYERIIIPGMGKGYYTPRATLAISVSANGTTCNSTYNTGDINISSILSSYAKTNNITFEQIKSKPTTIAGYGLSGDAYTKAEVDDGFVAKSGENVVDSNFTLKDENDAFLYLDDDNRWTIYNSAMAGQILCKNTGGGYSYLYTTDGDTWYFTRNDETIVTLDNSEDDYIVLGRNLTAATNAVLALAVATNETIVANATNAVASTIAPIATNAAEAVFVENADYALTNLTGAAVTLRSGEIGNLSLTSAQTSLALDLNFSAAADRSGDAMLYLVNEADTELAVGPSASVTPIGYKASDKLKAGTNLVCVTRLAYSGGKSVVNVAIKEVK